MYRGLILDFGGVITTDFYGALRAFGIREGLGAGAVEHVLRETEEGRAALAAVEDGQLSQHEYEIVLARLLGVDADGLLGRALADLRPCQPVLDLVARARSAGIATAVLSNSWGTGVYDPYAGYDLEGRFDAVVISDQVRLRKPGEQIYQLTADKLGVPPSACVFVDDTAHNLPPAERLGMVGVLFSDVDSGIARLEELLRLG
ncbi:HAD family phosphatase [Streptosporangium sp. NBC_01495]|uniref:HAD family hydrolase n=1 Tax=Streptosporangium sp. NBC_01495 TaxID=2903899 RepID=UPI002E32633F|nr:HAD family phosphatase [Streptosporangium sp. NBC_01495]